ncbi:MAG: lysylphosphatidylglycerol synthase domain-containing protein [Bacteroidota bacterium]
MSPSVRSAGLWLLALLFGLGLFWHWKQQLSGFDWISFSTQVFQLHSLPLFLIVVALMPINWWLETKKFQHLLRPHHQWSFERSLRAVLIGLGAGSLTPNRIGDYAGRVLAAKKAEVSHVLLATFQGGLCQWIGFLLLAWPGLVWVGSDLLPVSWQAWSWWALPVGPILATLIWYCVLPRVGTFNLNRVKDWYWRRLGLGKWLYPVRRSTRPPTRMSAFGECLHLRKSEKNEQQSLEEARETDAKITGLTAGRIKGPGSPFTYLPPIGISVLRLMVYCTQVYLLLLIGGLELPYLYAMAGIAGVYLLQAGIPLPPGIHLMLRAELTATLFGGDAVVLTAGLTAFGLLYVINVLLPTLLTPYLLLQNNPGHASESI